MEVHRLFLALKTCYRTHYRRDVNLAIQLSSQMRAMGFQPIYLKHRHILWCLRSDIWDSLQNHRLTLNEKGVPR